MADAARRPRVSPPTLTIVSLVLIQGGVWLLGYGADDGSAASARFVASLEWVTWATLAGFSTATFAVMLVLGLGAVIRPPTSWGLTETPKRRRYGYLVVASVFVLGLAAFILIGSKPAPAVASLPVQHIIWRTRGVVLAGYVAVIPWLALVWLAHAACAQLEATTRGLPQGGLPTADVSVRSGQEREVVDAFQRTVDQLRRLWRLMTYCVTAAAITVVVAIVTAGALRAAFLAYAPDRAAEFPGSEVLLFGALFAALQAAIGLPLVISWRARARDLVERAYPFRLGGPSTDAWITERARLEALLHLDVTLLRNPLAALSILAPLVTSVLAVFIPGLSKS